MKIQETLAKHITMKKLLLFFLVFTALGACRKDNEIPDLTCRVFEADSDVPIPLARVQWYEISGFGSAIQYDPVTMNVCDEQGTFQVPRNATFDEGLVLANSDWQYSELGRTSQTFTTRSSMYTFYVPCKSTVYVQLHDDANVDHAIHHVDVHVNSGFRNQAQDIQLDATHSIDKLEVKSHLPTEVEFRTTYTNGCQTSEMVTLDPMTGGASSNYIFSY